MRSPLLLLVFLALEVSCSGIMELGKLVKEQHNSTEAMAFAHSTKRGDEVLLTLTCPAASDKKRTYNIDFTFVQLGCPLGPRIVFMVDEQHDIMLGDILREPCKPGTAFVEARTQIVECEPHSGSQVGLKQDMSATSPARLTSCQQNYTVPAGEKVPHRIATAWVDGLYLLNVRIAMEADSIQETAKSTAIEGPFLTVQFEFGKNNGYLSAVNAPLLPFYATMCTVYALLALFWLVFCSLYWRDLLRLQLWIGGVIFLGMVESAVYLGELDNLNKTGTSTHSTLVFGELVSALKRALARMLVLIVSLGYGIVKPQLGPAMQKVVLLGASFFIFASIEGVYRVKSDSLDKKASAAALPLAIIDAIACFWVFTALVETTRTLRVRRNVVKLSIYRHFINTLVFCVLSAIAFSGYSLQLKMLSECPDWRQLWLNEAYWPLLFTIILVVIMFLWRPSANNQAYAYSPLLDTTGDDDDEIVLTDMADVKSRTAKKKGRTGDDEDADLQWVEEHIPSVGESLLPSLVDEDDERRMIEYELSKMQ